MKSLAFLSVLALLLAVPAYAEIDPVQTGAGAEGAVEDPDANASVAVSDEGVSADVSSDANVDATASTTTTADPSDTTTAGAQADYDTARVDEEPAEAPDTAAESVMDDTNVTPEAGNLPDSESAEKVTQEEASAQAEGTASPDVDVDTDPSGDVDVDVDANADADTSATGAASDGAASVPGETIRGTVVSVNQAENEIVIRDEATGGDRRITVDPNVLSATTIHDGDTVSVELAPGESARSRAVRIESA